MSLRIALFGQAPLAVDCLERLQAGEHRVVGVFAPAGTGRPDPLSERARSLGLPLFQRRFFQRKGGEPIAAAVEEHRSLRADLNVLASFTYFLPAAIADAPPLRSLCFHPSLLPRYRGGHALQWQIIEGERESGVTIFVPDGGVDTGPVVVQKGGVAIAPSDTAGTLFFKKLAPLGAEALIEAVQLLASGSGAAKPQDEAGASHQGLVDDAAAAIDLSAPASAIDRRVRGCDPAPGAFVRLRGQVVRLHDVSLEPASEERPAGEIAEIGASDLVIALRGGRLRVGRVRADAAKEPAAAFAARHGLSVGVRLSDG